MKIVLTGGRTKGHAMANQILIPEMVKRGWSCLYIGSHSGVEKDMITGRGLARYVGITTGTLRPYFSLQNIAAVFWALLGMLQAIGILRKEKTDLVFSGGGFSSIPVVLAAYLLGIPVKLRGTEHIQNRSNLVIRPELITQPRISIPRPNSKPTLLVMGGSLGSEQINHLIWTNLSTLTNHFQVIHLCGKGNYRSDFRSCGNYMQYEFVENIGLLYKEADVVITGCKTNTISECLALGKRMICISESDKKSWDRQRQNADFANKHGNSMTLTEADLSLDTVVNSIDTLLKQEPNSSMVLTPEQLKRNCNGILSDLENTVWEAFEDKIRKGRIEITEIDWKRLNVQDFLIYSELFEAVGE